MFYGPGNAQEHPQSIQEQICEKVKFSIFRSQNQDFSRILLLPAVGPRRLCGQLCIFGPLMVDGAAQAVLAATPTQPTVDMSR